MSKPTSDTLPAVAVAAANMFNGVVDALMMKDLAKNIDLGSLGIKLADAGASNTVHNAVVPSQTREV